MDFISIGGNSRVIGISYSQMNLVKNDLKRARDRSNEVSRRINGAKLKLQVDAGSSRVRASSEDLYTHYRELAKRQTKIDRMINNIDYSIRRYKEVDARCAARIRSIGKNYRAKEYASKKSDEISSIFSSGLSMLGNCLMGGAKSLWENGKDAFNSFCGSDGNWLYRHPGIRVALNGEITSTLDKPIESCFSKFNSLIDSGFNIFEKTVGISDKNPIYWSVRDTIKEKIGFYEGTSHEVANMITGIVDFAALLAKFENNKINIGASIGKKMVDVYNNPEEAKASFIEEGRKIKKSIDSYFNEVNNDPYKRGNLKGHLAAFGASLFVGAGELKSASKLGEIENAVNKTKTFEKLDIVDDVEKLIESKTIDDIAKEIRNPKIDIINNSDEWIKSLSKEELQALNKYQTTDIYEAINSSLRNGEVDDELIGIIEKLDNAISKGSINNEIELYRGFTKEDIIENWDKIIERQKYTFRDDGYVSTSLKPAVADNFAMLHDDEGIFAYIKVSNTNGANINAITSGVMDESEILLERGLKYRITKAWEEEGYKYIIMEVSK